MRLKNNVNVNVAQAKTIEDKLNDKIAKTLVINKVVANCNIDDDIDESMMIREMFSDDPALIQEYKKVRDKVNNKYAPRHWQLQNLTAPIETSKYEFDFIIYNCRGLENSWQYVYKLISTYKIGFFLWELDVEMEKRISY